MITKTQKALADQRKRNVRRRREAIAAESPYARAAALWVSRKTGIPLNNIWGVTFAHWETGYCDTCAGTASGLEYKMLDDRRDLKFGRYEFPGTYAGEFIQEAVWLLKEIERLG